jgi:transcriptional regulator with XRE-family HTH domain
MNAAAGKRLRDYMRTAMSRAEIETVSELARRSEVGRDTLQAWWRGERQPTPLPGGRVAKVLGVTYAELLAAWDGQPADLEPQQLIAAFEWAIAQVRAGLPPPEVLEDVAEAQRHSASQRRPRSAGPRTRR